MENFYEEVFENQDFTQKPLPKGEYEYCTFQGCNFAQADLSNTRFIETEFLDSNLSNAKILNTAFQDVRFKNCKMLGLLFDTCNEFGLAMHFEACTLNHSRFYQRKLVKSSFEGCELQEVDFAEALMNHTVLRHCNLLGALFDQTNLEKADLRNSRNYVIDPDNNYIKGAKFSLPEVIRLLDKYHIEIE